MATFTCGDSGGTTQAGKPCGRRVAEEGIRCPSHPEIDPHAEAKARALESVRKGESYTIEDAAKEAGVCREQFWRWRKADPEFDAELQELLPDDEEFLEEWKGSAKKRAMSGEMSGTLEIWFIGNIARQVAKRTGTEPEWQDIRHTRNSELPLDMESLPQEAVDRIAAGEDPFRAVAESLREMRRIQERSTESPLT